MNITSSQKFAIKNQFRQLYILDNIFNYEFIVQEKNKNYKNIKTG